MINRGTIMYIIRKCYFWDEDFIRICEWVADDFDAAYSFIKKVCPNSEIKELKDGFFVEYEGLYGDNLSTAELVTYRLYFSEVQNVNEIDQ